MSQINIEKLFLIVSDYFSYKIGPIDLVMELFSSLDIGTYILPTRGSLCSFWGIRATSNRPKNVHKGPQVRRMYGPRYKLQNGPLTKLLGPFLWEK
jgi:hypothetical protein